MSIFPRYKVCLDPRLYDHVVFYASYPEAHNAAATYSRLNLGVKVQIYERRRLFFWKLVHQRMVNGR